MKVIWAPLAEEQAADAFAYIASERPAAAVKWFEPLVSKTESLSVLPDQGRMVPEAQRPSLHEVFVEPYRVVYHRGEEVLVVLSVQHERPQDR
jgi:toxin ParE1/3/4